uniref:Uncharacterized protein n=1 Tax=Romanomermis culicivorax TaxID=13658 RepID=A0A915KZZ9_ROMCU
FGLPNPLASIVKQLTIPVEQKYKSTAHISIRAFPISHQSTKIRDTREARPSGESPGTMCTRSRQYRQN